jgi:membrane fusion protein (multidrug efflux system)
MALQKNKKTFLRFLPVLIVVLLILVTIVLAGKVKDEQKRLQAEKSNAVSKERPPANVVVQEMVPGQLRERLNLPGIVEEWERLDILAEVRGMIKAVKVEEGQRVKKGDVVALIDSRDYKNTLNRIRASYNLALANQQRLSQLHEQGIVPQAEFDKAEAEVEALAAELEIAKLQLERCRITAPITGVINDLPAKEGLYLSVGDPLATIFEIDRLKVIVGIPEADVDAVRKIDSFEMIIEALGNKKIVAAPDFLAIAPDSMAQVYRLELAVDNKDGALLPGMFARVEIVKHEFDNALSIPLYAVISRNNKHYIILEQDSTAEMREIELGILDGWQIQITKGLKPGEQVIVVGHRNVDQGQKLNVVKKITDPAEITR